MNYSYYQTQPCQYDEFISKGICAINPNLSSLQEVILIYLKELSYYILLLKKFGAENEIIKDNVIEAVSGINASVEYNHEQFQKLVSILANDLSQAKTLYANLCKQNGVVSKFIKPYFKHGRTFNITDIIKKGEKYFIQRNVDYTSEQKNMFDIMLFLVKNICTKVLQIKSFNKNYHKAYYSILTLLNTMNCEDTSNDEVKSVIDESTREYQNLTKLISDTQEEVYGQRASVNISFAPRTGKAILVSGIDMTQLEAVLEATKSRGVDVYTHGLTMLMAHTLAKFKSYPNLVGHFGKGPDNSLFDFAAFPGAILMTRYLFQKIEYLYRGRLFTTDSFAPSGTVKIIDNNFEPLIQAALESKGFTKKEQELIHRVGLRRKFMERKVLELFEKMEKNEIRHLYFVGILRNGVEYKEYFDKFFDLMPKDCFAISLSHEKNEENVLHVDSFYDYLFIYEVLDKFNQKKPLKNLNISIFITKCDQYTITNIINFSNMGVKNIFLCKCIPTLINPTLVQTMVKNFGIKELSTPEKDLEITLSE